MNDLGDAGLLTLSDAAVSKAGNVMAVTRLDGSAPVGTAHPLGIYRDDSRFVSGWALALDGTVPVLLAGTDDGPATTTFELTNPPLGPDLPLETLRLRLRRELDAAGAMRDMLVVRSHARTAVAVTLTLQVAADLLPMLEVRDFVEPDRPAAPALTEARADGLRIGADGRDGVRRTLALTASPVPAASGDDGTLRWDLALAPRETFELRLGYAFEQGTPAAAAPAARASAAPAPAAAPAAAAPAPADVAPAAPAPPAPGVRPTRGDATTAPRPTLTLSDALHQRVLDRALGDLDMLRSELDGRTFFAAGIPWFACLFGRDSLITATEALAFEPAVAADTLRVLATHLGTVTDPRREEQPGKVLHELRAGEALAADLHPVARYYGSVDATALWLGLLADHADWTGDLALFDELRPTVDATLAWLDAQSDLLTYALQAPNGLRNQGWKDSVDGIARADGTWLEAPIALAEPQGYAIRARRGIARLLRIAADREHAMAGRDHHEGDPAAADRAVPEAAADRAPDAAAAADRAAPDAAANRAPGAAAAADRARADALDAAADAHAARLADAFRLPGGRGFSMALDRDGVASDARASNQGHLLWSGALADADAAAVRDAVTGPELFSGWGVRTFGTDGAGYSPYGYHLGTVWPHDTAIVAAGLRRHGFDAAFDRVAFGLLEAATLAPRLRLPELFAGFDRAECPVPVPHPVACQPQAWSAGAVPWLHTLALGLRPDGLDGRLEIVRPRLPPGVDRATITGLQVAGATVDLRFERHDGEVELVDADVSAGRLDVAVDA